MLSQEKFPWIRNKVRAAKNLAFIHGSRRRFRRFEASFHPETWRRHDSLLAWAESQVASFDEEESLRLYRESEDPVVRQGYKLATSAVQQFRNRCREFDHIRILIHVPPATVSSAGFSLFSNFLQSFRFLGVPVREFGWFDDTREILEDFQPTVLLTSDHDGYLSRINWKSIAEYRQTRPLGVGLTASLQEYGNTSLQNRLNWADQHDVNFYYSFRAPQYVSERYRPFFERGYQILHLEFGANPLLYYPVPGIKRDLNYVFLGSSNPDKRDRLYSYCGPVFSEYPGYIDGPWWSSIAGFGSPETHRFLCARAKVGLNLHIQNQIDWACELNERTYNLAACGVPQLIDAPKLLFARFQPDSFFVADTPAEYKNQFKDIMNDPQEAQRRALQAQREVFTNHTVFHRVKAFVESLLRQAGRSPNEIRLEGERMKS